MVLKLETVLYSPSYSFSKDELGLDCYFVSLAFN
jgi:hypothetical protein